jgi:glutaredoxin
VTVGPVLTLVTTADCHLCEHARRVLDRLRVEFRFDIEEIDWESSEGQALVVKDAVVFPPALYLNGRLAAFGRLSEGQVRRTLAAVPM